MIIIVASALISGSIMVFNYTKCNKKIILVFSISLACISYSYMPVQADDLYRHYLQMDSYKGLNLIEVIGSGFLFVNNLALYFIGLTGLKGILPLVATFITYFLLLDAAVDIAKTFKPNKLQYSLLILLLLGIVPYTFVVSGIRFYTSVAIFVYACYREFVKKNSNAWTQLLYTIPIFIHYSLIILFAFKIILRLTYKNKLYFKIVCLIFITYDLWKNAIISVLLSHKPGDFIDKLKMYSQPFPYDSLWQRLLIIFLFIAYIVTFFIIILNKRTNKEGAKGEIVEGQENSLKYLSILFFSISIGNIQSFYLPERFLIIAVVILIMYVMEMKIQKNNIICSYYILLTAVIGVSYYVQFVRRLTGTFQIFNVF